MSAERRWRSSLVEGAFVIQARFVDGSHISEIFRTAVVERAIGGRIWVDGVAYSCEDGYAVGAYTFRVIRPTRSWTAWEGAKGH